MGALTEDLPKGMLTIAGKTLIERQLEQLRASGLDDIIIVTGYQAEKINYRGVRYYHNPDYASTNMVETLMCAREEMDAEVMVAYSDIIYSQKLAQLVCSSPCAIGVAVDTAWRDYWIQRYGSTETDLESLVVSPQRLITEIGRPVDSSVGLDYRYIGLLKFSASGIKDVLKVYDAKKRCQSPWQQSGNPFAKGYMTDLLNESIEAGLPVHPIVSEGGWLEFDTAEDYGICLGEGGAGLMEKVAP